MSISDGENKRTAWHREVSFPPILFNIYTNDQHLHNGTRSFIYADDMCATAQQPSFVEVETTIEESLSELTQYYRSNNLRANPDKPQVTAFHLRNKETKRTLKAKWNKTYLENTPYPKYLGFTLDRTLSYKQYIHNTKMKVETCMRDTMVVPEDTACTRLDCCRHLHKLCLHNPCPQRWRPDSIFWGKTAVAPCRLAGSASHKSGGRRVKSWPDDTHKQTQSSHLDL